ncbi:MAG: hypothetical protein HZA46_01695 [Planctomycetales bacterium]|nr:hypothetical protein [Planctomycetales bacterium]
MPLPMKTLREASIDLGMPESEIRAMVSFGKVRAVMKKGNPTFAPDELAKIRRQRKTLPESAIQSSMAEIPSPAKPIPPKKPQPPRRFGG